MQALKSVIADAQVHIWCANTPQRPWPPDRASYVHGAPSFGAESILAEMDGAGVDRAVLVPAFCAGDRNDIALAAARAHPDRFAVVGRMTMGHPDARRVLEQDLGAGMAGLRLTFLDDEAVKLTDGSMDWVWPLAEERGIRLMLMAPLQSRRLLQIARNHPSLRFAVDHLGLSRTSDPRQLEGDLRQLLALADTPNVSVKATAFGWFEEEGFPFPTFLGFTRRAIDAFGADRVFWGTDFSRLKGGYRGTVDAFEEYLGFRDAPERQQVMGDALCRWLGWPTGAARTSSAQPQS